ncbi:hypothetical protein HR11_10435 [Porphyromonas macacae]|nr:hypothetical protein HR11_10435 [Porphyromonas macacae]
MKILCLKNFQPLRYGFLLSAYAILKYCFRKSKAMIQYFRAAAIRYRLPCRLYKKEPQHDAAALLLYKIFFQ